MAKVQKSKKAAKRRYVPRQTRKFQLRQEHPIDRHVGEVLDYARSQRREVTLIRDAVQMYYALEQGDMSLLLEKFPFVGKALAKPESSPTGGGVDLQEIKSMLEIISKGQTTGVYLMQSTKPAAAPKVAVAAAPVDTDKMYDDFMEFLQ